VEETLSSKPITGKTITRSSSLTQVPRPSSQSDRTPSQLISRTVEAHRTFKSGPPTPDGSNCSSMTMVPL
jgi:hypothetical protein